MQNNHIVFDYITSLRISNFAFHEMQRFVIKTYLFTKNWNVYVFILEYKHKFDIQYNFYKWGVRDGEYPGTPPFPGYSFFKKG